VALTLIIAVACVGCQQNATKNNGSSVGASGPSAESPEAVGISPQISSLIEAYIRLSGEYCTEAAKVQDNATLHQYWPNLNRIQEEYNSVNDDLLIAAGKLTPKESKVLDDYMLGPRVQQSINQHKQARGRVESFAKPDRRQ
jgi:hypothetical protein